MSDETPRLKLPQLVSQQEMTNVTWNEALAKLDALSDLVLLGQYINDPPANPHDGDAYLLGAAPTGAWAGYAYKIASCLDGGWRIYTPFDGLRAVIGNTAILYTNGTWTPIASTDFATKSGSETLTNKTLSAASLTGATLLPNGVIDANGNLALGTRTPASGFQLVVASAGNPFVQFNGGVGLASGFYHYNGLAGGSGFTFFAASDSRAFAFLNSSLSNSHAPIVVMQNQSVGIGDGITPRTGAMLDVGGAVFPHADNSYNLGSASYRWGTVYAGTGTINTSALAAKTDARGLSDAECAAAIALASNVRVFRFVDAVEKKGAAARLHIGMIFEDVVATLEAHGLDPTRYGIICRDPALKRVERSRRVRRQKCETVVVPKEVVVVTAGVATVSIREEKEIVPAYRDLPLVDERGCPVLDSAGRPRRYREPVIEEIVEHFEFEELDTDDSGGPRWILGLRYAELTQFIIAGLAARLNRLETSTS